MSSMVHTNTVTEELVIVRKSCISLAKDVKTLVSDISNKQHLSLI